MDMMKLLVRVALALSLALGALAQPVAAGAKIHIGGRCNHSNHPSLDGVNHSAWDVLLHRHVDSHGMVDYTSWQRSTADRRALDEYLRGASCVELRRPASRAGQLAFWINLYNALTVKGILQDYPVSSIKDLQSWFGGYHIWKDLLVAVDRQYYSLEQIEHDVLRPMGEPRIHFAIVCASVGCPKLRDEAYTARRLEHQLTEQAREFLADPDKLRVDRGSSTVYVSPILKWFAEDFGRNQTARLRTIAPYMPAVAQRLVSTDSVKLHYLRYDWSLNDQQAVIR